MKNEQNDELDNIWTVNETLTDEKILEYNMSILASPSIVFSPTGNQSDSEPFYSKSQMVKMFREGCLAIMRRTKGFLSQRKPYTVLREMKVGDTAVFPNSKWSAARSAASKIKKDFGSTFRVKKISDRDDIGEIQVKRLS